MRTLFLYSSVSGYNMINVADRKSSLNIGAKYALREYRYI